MPGNILRHNPAPELPELPDLAVAVVAFVAGLVFALTVAVVPGI